jgi:hypothetical protein
MCNGRDIIEAAMCMYKSVIAELFHYAIPPTRPSQTVYIIALLVEASRTDLSFHQ